MVNTKILLSVVIVILIGVTAAGYQINSQNPGFWQPTTTASSAGQSGASGAQSSGSGTGATSTSTQTSPGTGTYSSGSSGQTGGNNMISASEAKSIATKYIEQKGASAGTPELKSINGKNTYIVPVIMNGEQVGEIYIDPTTGKNLGGAGGAP